MNKIHKSIFNEQTGTYVAVSENTRNKGKSGRKVLAATALAAALGMGAMGSAQAQLVSACTGVSLPTSVVTDIVGDVVNPLVKELVEIPLVGPLISALGLGGVLDDIAAGDPIKLNVLDTSGTVLSDGAPCQTTADSYTLNGEGGIAIGGNKITGLGANGKVAEAGHITAIAFGNSANADAANSIAFGTGAEVQADATGAVALGAGSLATDEWTVSVGNDGSVDQAKTRQRRITNVAEGINANDAATYGQLSDAINNITTSGLVQQEISTSTITVGKNTAGTEVDFTGKYLDGGGAEVALKRKLVGIEGGELSATSAEAITGAQLFASSKSVADALGGDSVVDATTGAVSAPDYELDDGTGAKVTVTGVEDALTNLDGRVATNTGDIANIQGDITNITNGVTGMVRQDATTREITVGAGTDGTAVNFANNTGTARTLSGLANGNVAVGSTEAITGDQLFTSSKSVADALGGGSTVNTTTGAVSAPAYELDDGTNTGKKVTVTDVEGALTNLDGRVTSNTGRITTIEGDITKITNGTLGIVKQNATTGVITVGGETGGAEVNFRNSGGDVRKLTGIANGNVVADSAEAVTGDQLNTTNLAVASALTALGGGASIDANGVVTGPTYNIGGTKFDNVGGALTNLDGRVTSNTNRITTIEGDITGIKGNITNIQGDITNIQGDITDIKNGTAGIVKFDAAADKITVGSEVAGSSVDFTGKDASGAAIKRKLTGIADGELSATSSDAVTGKQLNATNQQVKASSQFAASALGGGAEAKDDGTFVNPLYALQEVQQDGSKKAVTFNNVGGALTSLNTSVASLQDQINNNTSMGLVRQDPTSRVISVGGNTDGTEINVAGTEGPRVISGVAAGKGPTDAVNVQQAEQMISGATNSLRGEIRRAEKRADAGTAAATAVATLGQAYQPGQSAFSMGGGVWRGETGYAIGASTVSENGKWLLKGAVNGSGRGGAGGGASVTYLW